MTNPSITPTTTSEDIMTPEQFQKWITWSVEWNKGKPPDDGQWAIIQHHYERLFMIEAKDAYQPLATAWRASRDDATGRWWVEAEVDGRRLIIKRNLTEKKAKRLAGEPML